MGVRGKVEAVIYAAEEPVTLAQLVALFGEEALAERQRGAAEDGAAPADAGESAIQQGLDTATQQQLFVPVDHAAGASDEEESSRLGEAPGEPVSTGEPAEDAETHRRASRLRDREAREELRSLVATLMAEYESSERGMEIREIAGGYQVATKPEYHDAVRAFAKSLKPPMKLTLQALETLAVIAYKQPVTSPEVSEIRGVDSGGVLGSLISRKLVTTAGRKAVVGRPILYKTTKEFLLRFGLKDLAELPSMEEFEKMAGELQALSEEPDGAGAPLPEAAPQAAHAQPPDAPAGEGIMVDVAEPEPAGIAANGSGRAVAVEEDVPATQESTGE